ncbi:methyltransferase [Heyndrickxia shackletonii]|uniref:Methyltransferase n=1 Tax=Heyndrickxia shackletonii TaxID=157838 RepID=A0A0Q3WRW3_9BACI|nr:class I SAM-dependent methyltransferase [Heyndrickxia shackletonii]KQL50871.1 methyltransferase [Heyndrickxia shackletonii]NEZ01756.1 class I SAM-dependent methyltransferase [Heyndrickxia shackletonii]
MNKYGNELFKGAAPYYSKYRPIYPSSLIRYLVDKFSLNGEQQLLDLGCGTGHLTIRFSDWCKKIVGIDRESEMIEEARRVHQEIRIGNIDWYIGTLEKYKQEQNEKFHLVTIAKAFHWMDRSKILEELYEMVTDSGGVAIIDNYEPEKKLEPWQNRLNKVIEKWYGQDRRAGNSIYTHPTMSHEEVLSNSNFNLEIHHLPTYEITWTIDSILGNLYSTSYGSKRFLGDNIVLFERELREALLNLNQSGEFKEKLNLSVKLGLK